MNNSDLVEIAGEFGTPTYVYDANRIVEQYRKLHRSFNPIDVKLHYALKALSNINVHRLLKHEGAGLDAVSIQEVNLGFRYLFPQHNHLSVLLFQGSLVV